MRLFASPTTPSTAQGVGQSGNSTAQATPALHAARPATIIDVQVSQQQFVILPRMYMHAVANIPEETCFLPSKPAHLDHQPEQQVPDLGYSQVGPLKTTAAPRIDLHEVGCTQLLRTHIGPTGEHSNFRWCNIGQNSHQIETALKKGNIPFPGDGSPYPG